MNYSFFVRTRLGGLLLLAAWIPIVLLLPLGLLTTWVLLLGSHILAGLWVGRLRGGSVIAGGDSRSTAVSKRRADSRTTDDAKASTEVARLESGQSNDAGQSSTVDQSSELESLLE